MVIALARKALRWEKGYNIQSVSEPALKRVAKYVEAQPFRHPDEAIAGWYPTRFGSEVASATGAEWRLEPPTRAGLTRGLVTDRAQFGG